MLLITLQLLLAGLINLDLLIPSMLLKFHQIQKVTLKYRKKKFSPNVFIDIKNEITKKLEALSQYKNELEKWPHPRSLKALKILAHYRGTQSGLDSAEAFQLIRENKKLI